MDKQLIADIVTFFTLKIHSSKLEQKEYLFNILDSIRFNYFNLHSHEDIRDKLIEYHMDVLKYSVSNERGKRILEELNESTRVLLENNPHLIRPLFEKKDNKSSSKDESSSNSSTSDS